MKILPINYNLVIQKPLQNVQKAPFIHFNGTETDTFELSKSAPVSYVEQAKDISGIHCPRCGKMMLSEKDYQIILDKASKIETASDFSDLIEEYKYYVPAGMSKILRKHQTSDNDFMELFNKLCKGAFLKHKDLITKSNKYLLEFSKTLPKEKQEDIENFVNQIKPNTSSYNYSKKLFPLLHNCNLSKPQYLELLNNTILRLRNSSDYLFVFYHPNIKNMTPGEISQIMSERIFSKALTTHGKISNIYGLDNPNNEILTCQSCSEKTGEKTFLNVSDLEDPELKGNIRTYLQDISMKLGHKTLQTNSPYIYYLCNFIDRISKHEITFSTEEIDTIKKLNLIASRHSEFTPITQSKTDIPCAGCGSTMLPHEIKQKIEHELQHRSTIKGYLGILQKYDKYIGKYARETADLLIKLAEDNPEISKLKLVELLQFETDKKSEKEVEKVFKEFSKVRPYILQTRPLAEVNNYDKISKAIFEYIFSGKLKKDFSYMAFVSEGLKDFNLDKDMPVFVYTFLNKIKIICNKNSIVKYNDFDVEKDKDPLQTIIYKIFNSNLATADHLVARKKGGEATIDNMIGLCKQCNTIVKGGKDVFPWMIQNPTSRQYLPEQLRVIKKMAKRGEIENFDHWAENVAERIKKETRGKFDFTDQI